MSTPGPGHLKLKDFLSQPQTEEDIIRRDWMTRLGIFISLGFVLTYALIYIILDWRTFWVSSLMSLLVAPILLLGLYCQKKGCAARGRIFLMLGAYLPVAAGVFMALGTTTGLNYYFLVFCLIPILFYPLSDWPYILIFFLLNLGSYVAATVLPVPYFPQVVHPDTAQFLQIFSTITAWILVTMLFLLQQAFVAHHEAALSRNSQEKSRFFSLLAHDLRGPMGTLMHSLRFLSRDNGGNSPDPAFLSQLETSSQNLYSLLENLLTWAESGQGRVIYAPRDLPLDGIFREVEDFFRPFARRKQVRLQVVCPPTAKVHGDPQQLVVIFRNLLGNALKFTPSGGMASLSAETSPEGWKILVEDSGIGIPPEILQGLFTPGVPVKRPGTGGEPGTGLGLLICAEFARLHGASIQAANRPGGGASFSLTLPKGASQA